MPELYLWLAACSAHAGELVEEEDPLRADLAAIAAAQRMVAATLTAAPGLATHYADLAKATAGIATDLKTSSCGSRC